MRFATARQTAPRHRLGTTWTAKRGCKPRLQWAGSSFIQPHNRARSHTADLTLLQLLQRTAQALWQAYLALLPEQASPHESALALYQQAMAWGAQSRVWQLTKDEQDALAVACGQALWLLLPTLDLAVELLPRTPLATLDAYNAWRSRLEKVLRDELVFHAQEPQRVVGRAQGKDRGSYRMLTPVDPDISLRVHNDKVDRGYNVSVAVTPDFVREIQVATGATPDSVGIEGLVAAQIEHQGVVPPKLIYDQAGGAPKKIADVARVSDKRTQLVVRLVDYQRNRGRFGPTHFHLDEQGGLTCPNGQRTTRSYRSGGGDGWNYRFLASQCHGCPLAHQCRGDQVKPTSHRQVFISDYASQQRTAIAYTRTAAFQADMALRPHVERIIACLVRYNGARTTQGYGLVNADFQMKMAAMAYNLKHWHARTLNRERRQRVRSRSP